MLLWGVCTALHVWVRHRWQLYALRILIGVFEGTKSGAQTFTQSGIGRLLISRIAGFYPVTVTYLSLFYTRFEFGKRLSLFYGQAALGGALGGIISYIVFSRFRSDDGKPHPGSTWRPWQILFLLEGSLTMAVAVMGYFWLPHSVETAWFLSPEERQYAASRVLRDRDIQVGTTRIRREEEGEDGDEEQRHGEEARGLLTPFKGTNFQQHRAALDDRGLTPRDLFSSIFNLKIWHLLTCNILSAIPVYAFSVFLPLVLAPLTKKSNPALVNLLTAPPHLCGAVVLFTVAHYSDKYRIRLIPVLFGLVIMLLGLTLVVILPTSWAIPRYLALNLLLSGTYVASPLTVAWISNNSPTPGKRALLLGINGWGNFAGVLAAMLFKPKYAASGYIIPFIWTFVSVTIAFGGYILFLSNLRAINAARKNILDRWSEEAIELERREGTGPLVQERRWIKRVSSLVRGSPRLAWFAGWLDEATQGGREGDEKITFEYGL